jgi:hypothetical protein
MIAGEDQFNRNRPGRMREYFEAITKALAESETALVAHINRAGDKSWQAHAWLLERRFPERWGRKDRLEHTGKIQEEQTIRFIDVENKEDVDKHPLNSEAPKDDENAGVFVDKTIDPDEKCKKIEKPKQDGI